MNEQDWRLAVLFQRWVSFPLWVLVFTWASTSRDWSQLFG